MKKNGKGKVSSERGLRAFCANMLDALEREWVTMAIESSGCDLKLFAYQAFLMEATRVLGKIGRKPAVPISNYIAHILGEER